MMLFKRINPSERLENIVECYWIIEGQQPPTIQKIIPDGFPEIIFHYRDPYRIKISGDWEIQEKHLLAGQITRHFFLENTGDSGMLGIKLKPWAVTHLFCTDMKSIADKVITLPAEFEHSLSLIIKATGYGAYPEQMIEACEASLYSLSEIKKSLHNTINHAIDIICSRKGMVTVQELCETCQLGERQIERLFSRYVGLSPKFYSRIIRFNYIFELIQSHDPNWADIVYKAGYYDQSHFIRNFKAFTGEDPSEYLFENKTLANFFLNKPAEKI